MTDDKPDLYSIQRALIDNYSAQTVEQFAEDIKNGISPSKALGNFITSNTCSVLDSSVVIDLLKRSYDGIDTSQFSGVLQDSGYPFGDSDDMSDEDFDKIVTQTYENPPEW